VQIISDPNQAMKEWDHLVLKFEKQPPWVLLDAHQSIPFSSFIDHFLCYLREFLKRPTLTNFFLFSCH
jgi:hypothetical protein